METKTYSNKKAYTFAISIVFFIVLSVYVGKIANYIALIVFLGSFFFLEKIDIYILLFAIFPFANIFKASASSMSFLTICEIILFVFIFFDFLKNKLKFKSIFLFSILAFTIYLVVGFFEQFSFSVFIKMLIRPFILYYLFNSEFSYDKKKAVTVGIAYMLSVSMILMMFLSLNQSFMERVIDYLRIVQIQNGLQQLTRNGGLLTDPNYCSLAILMTLSLLGVLYYSKQVGSVYWLFIIPLIVMGFSTYSKSFFLCIIAYAVLMTMFVLFPKHPGWGVVTTAVVSVIAYGVVNGRIEVIELVLDRFQNGDITTGRSNLNRTYLTYLADNPSKLFFGSGITSYAIDTYNNVHNLFIESLYKLGIVGSFIYCILIRSCMYANGRKKRLVAYFPVIFMVTMYMALAGLDSFELIYYFIICGVSTKYTGNEIEKS